MSRQFSLTKASLKKIDNYIESIADIIDDNEYPAKLKNIITKDVKMIKDCAEQSIVDFYIESSKHFLEKHDNKVYEGIYDDLKKRTRNKLVDKYVSKETFDNNIDIYFNEVKREYILHPMGESEEMAFVPENRDIFIKNNLKLVINCAKRYQNLGFPLEDLIQAGNLGLLMAFNKFDTDRANLRFNIIKDIKESNLESFSKEAASKIIKDNFKYSKILDTTLSKIPSSGFKSKEEFEEWTNLNIKKASFSSIGFVWIRAMIICQLNKLAKVVHVPKSISDKNSKSVNIIRLDSVNPHTDDCYHDNQISEVVNEEFIIEDESIENMEKQNIFKELLNKVLNKLSGFDRRVITKRFGIGLPFPMSISEIADNEGVNQSKVKYSISNSMKVIATNIPEKDKETILQLLK